jgi:hypothetical protein
LKSQAALEYLTTYGWALLGIIVTLGALSYFGLFDPFNLFPSKCMTYGGLDCAEYKITSNEIKFFILNNLGNDADIINIQLKDNNNNLCTIEQAGLIPFEIKSNQKMMFNASGCVNSSYFKGNIEIEYLLKGNSLTHWVRGSISGRIETTD